MEADRVMQISGFWKRKGIHMKIQWNPFLYREMKRYAGSRSFYVWLVVYEIFLALVTEYKILIIEEGDYRFDREADGWVDPIAKEILIFNYKQDAISVKDLVAYQKCTLRHEITHAFLYESGLWQNSYGSKCWAQNEEMVDWFAIQEPKIHSAYIEAGCE